MKLSAIRWASVRDVQPLPGIARRLAARQGRGREGRGPGPHGAGETLSFWYNTLRSDQCLPGTDIGRRWRKLLLEGICGDDADSATGRVVRMIGCPLDNVK